MPGHAYLAIDLSTQNGRVSLGQLKDGILTVKELHRFSIAPQRWFGSLRWNVAGIWEEIKVALRRAAETGIRISSVSCDSWGCDYVWFNDRHPFLAAPYHHADRRTEEVYADVIYRISRDALFKTTGLQPHRRHTLFQLAHDLQENPELIGAADKFLNVADYFNFLLSGVARAEQSLACTTQLLDLSRTGWVTEFLERFSLPKSLFPEIVPSNTVLGPLRAEVTHETGLADAQVIATCSHSSAAAFTAVPEAGANWTCLSSGTRSWVARELGEPLFTPATLANGFSNEAGFRGMTMYRKQLPGLSLFDDCRHEWEKKRSVRSYEELGKLASQAKPLRSIVQLDALNLRDGQEVEDKLRDCCLANGEMVPETPGQIVRCIMDSLALGYRSVLRVLEDTTKNRVETIHMIGGGSRHKFLNQLTADATDCIVEAGPVEITCIGNLLLQAAALGDIEPAELRGVARDSFKVETFTPSAGMNWEEAAERLSAQKAFA